MGELTAIMPRHGHEFQAYLVAPPGKPLGAVRQRTREFFGRYAAGKKA